MPPNRRLGLAAALAQGRSHSSPERRRYPRRGPPKAKPQILRGLVRAAALAERAIAVWPAPVPVAERSMAFDWTRRHAAIAAIPDGRSTTYGDLAALAGTAAQAVRSHIVANPALPKAHRVLTAGDLLVLVAPMIHAPGNAWPVGHDERGT